MAKQTTEKKEFAWDAEKKIGEFGDNKKKTEVRICYLNGKIFISAQKYIASAKAEGGWKRTKNNTIEIEDFKHLQEMFSIWEMKAAFDDTQKVEAPAKPKTKKAAAPKEEPKKSTLKAKKQAEGAKEKATRKKKEAK